jgi:hypothetical protein
MIATILFVISLSLYFLVADYAKLHARFGVCWMDWALDILPPTCFDGSYLLWQSNTKDGKALAVAGTLQYIGGAALFDAFRRIWKRIPELDYFSLEKPNKLSHDQARERHTKYLMTVCIQVQAVLF